MSDGYVKIHRSLWTSENFDKEPFCHRMAFIWLVSFAAWRDHTVRYKDTRISLKRGQVAVSIRDLADLWHWHRARVDRFLRRLKTETVIETETETGITIVTICNYERFQAADNPCETPARQQTRQERDTSETQTEERKESKKRSLDSPSVSPPNLSTPTNGASASPPPRPKNGNGSRIPDSWKPSDEDVVYATTQGFSGPEIERISLDFRQYWQAESGKHATKLSWSLTWQRWTRTEADRKAERIRQLNAKDRMGVQIDERRQINNFLTEQAWKGGVVPMALEFDGNSADSPGTNTGRSQDKVISIRGSANRLL